MYVYIYIYMYTHTLSYIIYIICHMNPWLSVRRKQTQI